MAAGETVQGSWNSICRQRDVHGLVALSLRLVFRVSQQCNSSYSTAV